MITELALLHVRDGQRDDFISAMQAAKKLISASPGFISIAVKPDSEDQNLFLLSVEWMDIASHQQGFRGSARYNKWRELLHHFYDPMPEVRYFEESVL